MKVATIPSIQPNKNDEEAYKIQASDSMGENQRLLF